MTSRTRLVPILATLAVVVALAAGTASAAPAAPEGKAGPSSAAARAALADARAVMSGQDTSRDATMALLELWRQQAGLTGADRAAAKALLARPNLDQVRCTAANCYHWTTAGSDGVDATDGDGNGVPDYVDTVVETVDGVRQAYVAAGYRTPKPDGIEGGDARTDIYLEDTGADQLYGYCASDQPIPTPPPSYDAWSYCVLDNDYASSQFPTNTSLENLQVTAAHEYFHAVQFAYDAFEDPWLLEATATWAEDELYDGVDDNVGYLRNSPLTRPWRALDTFDDSGAQYGAWIFFRFLTENPSLDEEAGGLPVLVREIWERADGALGGPDDYSTQAVTRVLADHDVSFPAAFGVFSAANRLPALAYDEGNLYPSVGPAGSYKLSTSRKDSGWKVAKLAHLSSATARFVPGPGLTSGSWKLKVSLDLPAASSDPVAVITVVKRSGAPQVLLVPVNAKGAATRKVAFGSSKVKHVEVTLANASTRYDCWTGGDFSCQGTSLDDGRQLKVRATAVR